MRTGKLVSVVLTLIAMVAILSLGIAIGISNSAKDENVVEQDSTVTSTVENKVEVKDPQEVNKEVVEDTTSWDRIFPKVLEYQTQNITEGKVEVEKYYYNDCDLALERALLWIKVCVNENVPMDMKDRQASIERSMKVITDQLKGKLRSLKWEAEEHRSIDRWVFYYNGVMTKVYKIDKEGKRVKLTHHEVMEKIRDLVITAFRQEDVYSELLIYSIAYGAEICK